MAKKDSRYNKIKSERDGLFEKIIHMEAENKRLRDALESSLVTMKYCRTFSLPAELGDALKSSIEELDGGKSNSRPDAYYLIEFGYKQCERGENLQGAFTNYERLKGEKP